MGRPKGSISKELHIWTTKEKNYLKQIALGTIYRDIKSLMSAKFNYEFTLAQIKSALNRYKITTGLTGQFKKGNIPFNKGLTGICAKGSEKGWFKKGDIPSNHREVGSERINIDGYIEVKVKVKESSKWRLKQQLVWEAQNGKIPKGYAVIFGDGDRQNTDINNLILVSRQQLLILNKNKLIQNNADLTRTGVIIADLYQKISDRK